MKSKNERFPKSLALLGLSVNFTNSQFNQIMCFERSDEIRELAYKEWLKEQDERYDNDNWRWYLSYVQMKNSIEINDHYKYLCNKIEN